MNEMKQLRNNRRTDGDPREDISPGQVVKHRKSFNGESYDSHTLKDGAVRARLNGVTCSGLMGMCGMIM